MSRSDVEFPSGGLHCAAWLYRPDADGRRPLVVMAHGFSSTRELRLDAYAERFENAGVAALLFDYRHFGASPGEPRQLIDIKGQHQDYEAAVAYARGLDWVDPDRVALFGTSFSGGHVLAVGSRDSRLAAIIAQCPFTDGLATLRTRGTVDVLKATGAGLRDQVGAVLGRAPYYVPAVAEPGSLGVMTTPESKSGFEALVPADTRWENRVAARIMLRVAAYRPGRQARRISCPVLACVCDRDSLTPAQATIKFVSKAPRAEIKHYPVGHFDIYVGESWQQAVADQTDFLARHLLTPAPAPSPVPQSG
jgi:dienelactone hydrolase